MNNDCMTDKYPELNVENIEYLYWECDPGWSMRDIAKNIGCSIKCVHKFMIRNNIEIRDYSEAQKNRWNCDKKKEEYLEIVWTEEMREKYSEARKRVLLDDLQLKSFLKKMNDPALFKMGKNQKNILFLLKRDGPMFAHAILKEPCLCHLNHDGFASSIKPLISKGFISRKKEKNPAFKINKKQYYYSLTKDGEKLIELKEIYDVSKHKTKKKKRTRISKPHKEILKYLIVNGGKFRLEIDSIFEYSRKSIDDYLRELFKEGLLLRKKEFNPINNQENYRYYVSKEGRNYLTCS